MSQSFAYLLTRRTNYNRSIAHSWVHLKPITVKRFDSSCCILTLKPYDIAELFGKAYSRCTTGELAINGFRVTGIYPCNRHIFTDADFLAEEQSLGTNRVPTPPNTQVISGQSLSSSALIQPPSSAAIDEQSLSPSVIHPLATTGTASVSPTIDPASVSPTIDQAPDSSSILENKALVPSNQPSLLPSIVPSPLPTTAPSRTIDQTPDHQSGPLLARSRPVLPEDICPVPSAKKTSDRGRKAGIAVVITSSPYKKQLEESIERSLDAKRTRGQRYSQGRSRGRGRGRGKNPTAVTVTQRRSLRNEVTDRTEDDLSDMGNDDETTDESEDENPVRIYPENSDTTCIFCYSKFSDDTSGEIWVMCQSCELWAHNDCAGAEGDYYICDFCR
ncbi:hypothetical protein EVAR_12574_1 [Eumeta japonica]|uniref:Zinc finger PHD-type domain-containing protein n=1 Tax=Eumeta variegata TaxID=151549 RepID=A0A4C1UFI6_EUMVA|nr:hypothetical protein EVAR_12574_1 [Eumeta japonica]